MLFPFGHGLSYTEFAYDSIKVERQEESFLVSLNVTQHRLYEGKEIVQAYICLNENAAVQLARRLAALRRFR